MTRTGQQYPNSNVRPHQHWARKLPELDASWGVADAPTVTPNRSQRRDYVRAGARNVRKNIVGFGRWRRPRDKDYESNAKLTASPYQLAPRRERRQAIKARARTARRLRRRAQ